MVAALVIAAAPLLGGFASPSPEVVTETGPSESPVPGDGAADRFGPDTSQAKEVARGDRGLVAGSGYLPDRISIHKPNYWLFGFSNATQVKFQISLKYNLWPSDLFSVYFAYSQVSFWQLYLISAPLRENNYSPEFLVRVNYFRGAPVTGFDELVVGYAHESNGLEELASRGWDRLYAEQRYVHYFGTPAEGNPSIRGTLRLWLIFNIEDNPDIADFAGPGELSLEASSGTTQTGVWSLEGNFRKGGYDFDVRRGRAQLAFRWLPPWPRQFPFAPGFYAVSQLGYGESLDFYNRANYNLRLGVVFPG